MWYPFRKLVMTHLPSGAQVQTDGFDRGMSAEVARRRLMPLLHARIQASHEPGPPRLVRDYDLTGPDASSALRVLDGVLPVDRRRG